MRSRLITVACAAVLCIILNLGLWPFHAPRNDVSWLPQRTGLYFGRTGTVFSSGMLRPAPSVTIEIWLQPRRIWDSGTFLAFYSPGKSSQFSLRQSQLDLQLGIPVQDDQHAVIDNLYVDNAFPRRGATFITLTSGTQGTVVYLNGVLARKVQSIRLPADGIVGRLVLADSTGQSDAWSGWLYGLAIYDRDLMAPRVLEHYQAWTQTGSPRIDGDDATQALYLFDERAGKTIRSKTGSGPELNIPETYTTLGQMFLESPWSEFKRDQGFWGAVFKNVIGFIPLGGCFCAYFTLVRQTRRAGLTTVVLGFAVSLTIELLQCFLPTRDSGAMDLITNTLGTYIGVLLFRILNPVVAGWFSWW